MSCLVFKILRQGGKGCTEVHTKIVFNQYKEIIIVPDAMGDDLCCYYVRRQISSIIFMQHIMYYQIKKDQALIFRDKHNSASRF